MNKFLIAIFLIIFSTSIFAQDSNTLLYNEEVGSPKTNLTALNWLSGTWRGIAFGGLTEEIWSQSLGGSLMGSFKLFVDGKIEFYELMTITEENKTLIMRLKHFHSDLKGWEEKDEVLVFELVKVTPNKVYFDGLTFEKISDNEINVYVIISENDESIQEVKFNYKRFK